MMRKILVFVMMLSALMVGAQEKAQYRVTYDCDAQYGPQRQVYRWHLDIGETSAVFYSPNNREKDKVIDEVVGDNDVTSVMARLRTIKSEFPNPNPLEVLVESSAGGRYIYLNEIVSDKMWYEEGLPQMSWETTGRDTTVCGYACLQAKARVYGRDWTVWFAPEIPVSYGPYVLGGLPLEESQVTLEAVPDDISQRYANATANGKRLRYIASVDAEGHATIGLQEVGPESPLYSLKGTDNAIMITTGDYPSPMLIQGAGAGTRQTAGGILNDIMLSI